MADPHLVVRGRASFGPLTSGLSKLRTAAVVTVAAVGAAAVKVGVDSVKAASDAQQSLGATETVFGKYADTVVRESNRADQALGLSADEYRSLANVLGASLTGAGVPLKQATKLTGDLNKRAADLAATFGGETSEAIDAVSSLLRGEADPIERYGVSIKQADVNARLAAKGLDKLEGSARKQAEMQARLDLLFEKTKGSAGAFRRESETLAGQQQRLAAQFENLKAKVGTAALPALTSLTSYLNRNLGPAYEKAIDLGKSFVEAWETDGLDGVIGRVEELTDTQGRLAPIVEEVTDSAEALWSIVKKLGPAFLDASSEFAPFLSPLGLIGDALGVVADVVGLIPDNVLALGIQAGIAAAILPRLTGAVGAVSGAMVTARTNTVGFMTALSGRNGIYPAIGAMRQLAGAAKTAGGIGGMLALSAGAQDADKKTGTLLSTLGGAAVGFSVGGPWGALIGGGAGLAMGLFADRTDEAAGAMEKAGPVAGSYADSLDEVTAAVTGATRAEVYKQFVQSGAISQARELGVSTRDVVNAVLGQEGAIKRVNAKLAESNDITLSYVDAQGKVQLQTVATQAEADSLTRTLALQGIEVDKLSNTNPSKSGLLEFIGRESDAWEANTAAKKAEILATQDLSALRKTIPKRIITKIEQTGVEPTVKGIAKVAQQYKLVDRKQIRSLIQVTGTDISVRQVKRVLDSLGSVDKVKPNLRSFKSGVEGGTKDAEGTAKRGGQKVKEGLEKPIKDAKADLSGVRSSLPPQLESVRGTASTGGQQIGAALKSGIISGFAGTATTLAAQARAAVRAAIAAGRAEGKVNSPSKETEWTGRMLGEGLTKGLGASEPDAKRKGRDLIAAALAGVANGSQGIGTGLDNLGTQIERNLDRQLRNTIKRLDEGLRNQIARLKDRLKGAALDKAIRQAEREHDQATRAAERDRVKDQRRILKGLRDEFAELRKNGKQQDKNAAALATARDNYRSLVDAAKQYAAAIKSAFVSYGSVVGLGQLEDGSVSTSALLDQLRDREKDAKRFASLINSLRGTLNETSLQQLLDAGLSGGGLEAAEAIAAGGAAAITEINTLTASIAASGSTLGQTMATQFKQAGIDAAAGLVAGLEKEQKRLDRVAERMANALAKAVKKALGIKSPSRVFRGIGDNVTKGLALGLDDTYVRRQGAQLAGALTTGFAKPELIAAAKAGGSSSPTSGPAVMRVHLTADVLSRLQRGEEAIADIEYAVSAGARTTRLVVNG